MMSDENLSALEAQGHQYVLATKLRALPKSLQKELFLQCNYKTEILNGGLGCVGEPVLEFWRFYGLKVRKSGGRKLECGGKLGRRIRFIMQPHINQRLQCG
jgi:hypothetical protein